MASSLKDSIQQPIYTKAVILQGLQTPKGRKIMWIVVEDQEDKRAYEKFAIPDLTNIKTSEDQEGRKGCDNVEKIVTDIRSRGYSNIIGIRDADYLRYRVEQENKVGVFTTDERDLEMMLLEAPSVIKALRKVIIGFEPDIIFCKSICKELGYARVMNDVRDLGCQFQRKVKLSKIWDHCTHTLLPDWKERYETMVIANVKEGVRITKEDIDTFITDQALFAEPDKYICRGHDVMRLFHYKRKNAQECEAKCVVAKMIDAYSFEDFQKTNLYTETLIYAQANGLTLWQS